MSRKGKRSRKRKATQPREGAPKGTASPAAAKAHGRRRWVAPTAIIGAATLWALLTIGPVGLTWDESIYAGFVVRYLNWFQVGGQSQLTGGNVWFLFGTFGAGQVHPPLGKLVMCFFLNLLYADLPLYLCLRVASVFWYGVALTSTYFLVRTSAGRRAALCAVASLALMPRFFGHAHIAALDMPVAALWVTTALFARLSLKRRVYALPLGVVFGLALLAKVNALFIPLALVPWLVGMGGRRAAWPIAAMAVLGGVLFLAGWPVLWYEPVAGTARYLVDKLGYSGRVFQAAAVQANPRLWVVRCLIELVAPTGRSVIPVYYLGRTWGTPAAPWHYSVVLLIATTPLAMTAAIGYLLFRRRRLAVPRRPFVWFVLMNLFYSVAPFLRPGTPKYDGVRLFLSALPFLAVLAGMGLARGWEAIRAALARRHARETRLIPVLFWMWQVMVIAWLQPDYLSYYSGTVGGVWGAHKLGFETTYWGDTVTDGALKFASANARPGDVVLMCPTGLFVPDQLQHIYERLPAGVKATAVAGPRDWDVLILIPRQGMFQPWMWELYRKGEPAWEARLMGVPQCQVFVRRR